jgi:hypothetical protein
MCNYHDIVMRLLSYHDSCPFPWILNQLAQWHGTFALRTTSITLPQWHSSLLIANNTYCHYVHPQQIITKSYLYMFVPPPSKLAVLLLSKSVQKRRGYKSAACPLHILLLVLAVMWLHYHITWQPNFYTRFHKFWNKTIIIIPCFFNIYLFWYYSSN